MGNFLYFIYEVGAALLPCVRGRQTQARQSRAHEAQQGDMCRAAGPAAPAGRGGGRGRGSGQGGSGRGRGRPPAKRGLGITAAVHVQASLADLLGARRSTAEEHMSTQNVCPLKTLLREACGSSCLRCAINNQTRLLPGKNKNVHIPLYIPSTIPLPK